MLAFGFPYLSFLRYFSANTPEYWRSHLEHAALFYFTYAKKPPCHLSNTVFRPLLILYAEVSLLQKLLFFYR